MSGSGRQRAGRLVSHQFVNFDIQTCSDAVALLAQQPWVQRPRQAADTSLALSAAEALANHLRDFDPIDSDGVDKYQTSSCCGLFHDNSLPVPLQTDTHIRRERRFDAALQTINAEIKFRVGNLGDDDDFAVAALTMDHTLQRQALLGAALANNEMLRAEAEEQLEDVLDTVLGEAGLSG